MFARTELDAALEKQTGDINEARKRVMWLEDRMGLLCGKVRMRVSSQQQNSTLLCSQTPHPSVSMICGMFFGLCACTRVF